MAVMVIVVLVSLTTVVVVEEQEPLVVAMCSMLTAVLVLQTLLQEHQYIMLAVEALVDMAEDLVLEATVVVVMVQALTELLGLMGEPI
jgi:hypothetical protein